MSIQESYVKQAVNFAAQNLTINPEDGLAKKAGKFTLGAPTNATLALAGLVQTTFWTALYTAAFFPLYFASQNAAIDYLAGRITDASAATRQAAGQITGVWAKEEVQKDGQMPAPATKWEKAKANAYALGEYLKAGGNKALELGNRGLESSKPYFNSAKARFSAGLSASKQAAWNHKGKIAIATGTAGALGAEWYFNYPVSSAAMSAGRLAIDHQLSNNPTSSVEEITEELPEASTVWDNAVWLVTENPITTGLTIGTTLLSAAAIAACCRYSIIAARAVNNLGN